MPDCMADRNADVWGPLFAVADLAGGTWPEAVRMAATDAVLSAKASERPSLGAQLLADIHACFGNRSEEHTSELQSLMRISYAVFCLKKKTNNNQSTHTTKHSTNSYEILSPERQSLPVLHPSIVGHAEPTDDNQ